MAMGNDRYPTSLNSATSLLQKWAENNPSPLPSRPSNCRNDRIQFTQGGENRIGRENRQHDKNKNVKGTDGVFYAGIKCYRCGAEGHYAPECPDESNVTYNILFYYNQKTSLPSSRRGLSLTRAQHLILSVTGVCLVV